MLILLFCYETKVNEMCSKIYYLETSVLYALSGCFDKIVEANLEVITSLFALQEIVDGITVDEFHKRKVLLGKIMSYGLKIYPMLPEECVASAFYLDVSNFSEILYKKRLLMTKINMIIRADNYYDYQNMLLNIAIIDVNKEKKNKDEIKISNKNKISEIIDAEIKYINELRWKRKVNPEYIEIDINNTFGLEDVSAIDKQSITNKKIIKKLLDSLNIQYKAIDICNQIECIDKNALVAMKLGIDMYSVSKSIGIDKKKPDRNDIDDLIHLLYLRDENHVIVSDDRIYDFCTMKSMRMGKSEFETLVKLSRQ